MILQALTRYYEQLVQQNKIAKPGWAKVKVSWALAIDKQGHLADCYPLRHSTLDGKRMVASEMNLPAPVKRASNILPNFLCDNSSYILGLDNKGKPARSKECFRAAAELHGKILGNVQDDEAQAVISFFQNWDPDQADSNPVFSQHKEELLSGDNMIFIYENQYVHEDIQIRDAWQIAFDDTSDENRQCCLITGKDEVPELIHPSIKNVRGAQSSGAALVSFNAPAFCSFGKEQNMNAPVGKYGAFAYTSALNYLLADRNHVKQIGNASVVYWAESGEEQYQDLFSMLLDGDSNTVTDQDLDSLMNAIVSGGRYKFNGLPIDPQNDFYILGISPNAARLSVRFFFRRSFGDIIEKMEKHYRDIHIISDGRSRFDHYPLWALLRETVNQKSSDKTPNPQMSGDVMRSIITGGKYPETLMNQTMIRIRAEKDISQGRAAIIKGYLIRNTDQVADSKKIKEVATVALNSESEYLPYVLGRLFATLEGLQQAANPGINATIKDRFFNSACATPAAVFPILLKLSNSHLKKLEGGKTVYWSKQIGELLDKVNNGFPANLSLQEQGSFILGYYHQTQKRFEKKTNNREEE